MIDIKIIKIIEKQIPFGTTIANSYVNFSQMTGSVVAIVTDISHNGKPIIGYGFNSIGRYAATSIINDRMIPKIMNAPEDAVYNEDHSNLDPFKIYKLLKSNEKPGGHGDRAHAIGGIDMAVWDTVAKIEGKPLYKVLAERFNDGIYQEKIYTYAAGGYYYDGNNISKLEDEIKKYLNDGFTAVKIKIGGAPLKEDLYRIEAVIKIVGDASMVAVDANGRFDIAEALEYAKAMEKYGLKWYEEPVDPLDYLGHALVAEYFSAPIATGENLFSIQDVRNLIRYGGLRPDKDILQMDIPLTYGLVEYLEIIKILEHQGWSRKNCIPHGGNQLCLNAAAGLGLGGNECYPQVFQPFGGFADNIPVENGYIKLPDTPGIGFEAKTNLYKVMKSVVE